MFVDSDDMVDPTICEKLLEHAEPGCMPLCGWYEWKNNDIQPKAVGIDEGCYPIKKFAEIRAYGPWARLYERRLVESAKLHFVEGFAFAEDAIFNYEYYSLVDTFSVIIEPLYYYRILSNSLSHGKYIPYFKKIIETSYRERLCLAEKLKVDNAEFCDSYYANYFYSMNVVLENNMHEDAPGTWLEKMRRNNAVLRSEEFKKVYPYRYERPKDFTKRYIRALELSYHTGSYFWLWLVGVPGKIKEAIKRKR